jgi:mercuric ion transport protein
VRTFAERQKPRSSAIHKYLFRTRSDQCVYDPPNPECRKDFMMKTWKQSALTIPGIGVALLPKLICPFCWPLYAGIVSSVGLGFLIGTAYLVPITSAVLILTLAVLGFGARQRRGYGPFVVGVVASAAILISKFFLESNPIMYTGVGFLAVASMWNAWPRCANIAVRPSTPEPSAQTSGVHQREI